MQNYLVNSKKSSTFAPAFERKRVERGSALRSGRRGRVFESPLLDKKDSQTAVFFEKRTFKHSNIWLIFKN